MLSVRGNGLKLIRLFTFKMYTIHIYNGEETNKKILIRDWHFF